MASIQCERKEELNNEDKERLDGLLKIAKSINIKEQALAVVAQNECLNRTAPVLLQVSGIVGALKNFTSGSLSVLYSKTWKAYNVLSYTNPLGSVGKFGFAGLLGVKAAVVYIGKNKKGDECGWLLAFGDISRRKVYVEVGPKSKFDNIDWGQIEKNLDNDGKLVFNASSRVTGTRAVAVIEGASVGSAVGAYFTG